MRPILLCSTIVVLGAMLWSIDVAEAACSKLQGSGTGSSEDAARFQAWEDLTQKAKWSAWAQWMAESQPIGTVPGYSVAGVLWSCLPGGLGTQCLVTATLCER